VVQLYPQALGTNFSHLLRQAWVTLGLFLNPCHHTGATTLLYFIKINQMVQKLIVGADRQCDDLISLRFSFRVEIRLKIEIAVCALIKTAFFVNVLHMCM
jgi:hypothetical protein